MYEHTCPNCQRETCYDEQFDSNFCKECNIWVSQTCGDEQCYFCVNRPKTPKDIGQPPPPKGGGLKGN